MKYKLTTMTAVEDVFGISELFEKIIIQLESRDIFKVMRVSGSWKDNIVNSERIQQARVLEPFQKVPQFSFSSVATSHIRYPCYSASPNLQWHPVLAPDVNYAEKRVLETPLPKRRLQITEIGGWYVDEAEWTSFATLPPCQALNLWFGYECGDVIIYVKKGIRIGDIMKLLKEIESSGRKWLRHRSVFPAELSFVDVEVDGL